MNYLLDKFNDLNGKLPVALSLDVTDLEKYQVILNAYHDRIGFLKVNPAFVDAKTCSTNNMPSILDSKLGDVPHTMQSYRQKYFYDMPNKYHAVTLNPYCGLESLKAFTDDESVFSFIWTLGTDATANVWQQPIVDNVIMSGLLKHSNVGLVAPSNNIEYLKKIRFIFPDTLILMPGIGTQGGSIKDVKKAIGTDNIIFVIGRRLINSSDINEELKMIESEIKD